MDVLRRDGDRFDLVSVLGQDEGYAVKHIPLHEGVSQLPKVWPNI